MELTASHLATVGAMQVRRLLPRRTRRTIGAWCFADHLGPASVTEEHSLDIGPHPHIGLATVTWLLAGEAIHRDSLGSQQLIKPQQLNLMTAGHGVVHSEEATGSYRGQLHGIQLWIAQPEATRHGPPDFEHHADLPVVDTGFGSAIVLLGELLGARSSARADTPLLGADLTVEPGAGALSLASDFEHALIVLEGVVVVDGELLQPGFLGYLPPGRTILEVVALQQSRLMLLGGPPFPEPVLMSWNFVARTRVEMEAAYDAWGAGDDRFGPVASSLSRIPAPRLPWRRTT